MGRTDTYDRWIGIDVVDRNGDRLGEIADIYYDDVSQRPEWVSIKAGLFKGHRIAPIAGARFEQVEGDDSDDDGRLMLNIDKDAIDAAPHDFDDDGHLTPMIEQELYRHYGFDWNRRDTADYGYGDQWEQNRFDKDYPRQQPQPTQDRDAMTRSEEELRVSKQREQAGTARLRKHVVSENVNVKVPVQKEQVPVEREPITDASRADAMSGPDMADWEHAVTLTEERPVVTKQSVPKEQVRLAKETVTETKTVGGQVRKEQIDVEGDVEQPKRSTK